MRASLAATRREERGASAVEFGLVLLPLLYLVLGIIQYGVYFWSMNAGSNAVGDAVRRISVGDCQSTADLKAFLSGRLGSATTSTASAITTSTTWTKPDGTPASAPFADDAVGGTVRLTVEYSAPYFQFPFIPVPDDALVSRSFDARIEDVSPVTGGCS